MNVYQGMLDRLQNDTIVIALMLTTQCSFACRHCFYGCSPKGSEARPDLGIAYMSNDVLAAVKQQVDRLRNLGLNVEINLIGGEPTLRMDRFAEIIQILSGWNVQLEMTTNGWWLANSEKTRQFFQAVKPVVDSDGHGCDGLSVRISNDHFHKEWRKRDLPADIRNLWQYSADYDDVVHEGERVWVCCYCGGEHDREVEACEECGRQDIAYQMSNNAQLIVPEPSDWDQDPWIYIQQDKSYNPWQSGYCQVYGDQKQCTTNWHHSLTYEPDGALMDVCCSGSYLRAGTVNDDPIDLLIFADLFMSHKRPRCGTCLDDARDWVEVQLENARRIVSDARKEYDE